MSRVLYTDNDNILDKGKHLWPPRDPPTGRDEAVWAALAKLTARQRAVIELRHYGDLTFKQIGASLDISKQAAHATYNKAIKILEEELSETVLRDS